MGIKKAWSGQHNFSNESSGNGAGKPHFIFIGSISLRNACETVQKAAGKCNCTCCILLVSEDWRGSIAALYTFIRALQLRFHLWLQLIQSRPASRWWYALLGIFSLNPLTFEQLLRVSAPVSNCLQLSALTWLLFAREKRRGKERKGEVGKELRWGIKRGEGWNCQKTSQTRNKVRIEERGLKK